MASAELARCLFSPRNVALVGASGDPSKANSHAQEYLVRHGYKGKIFPINPAYEEIQGVRAFADLRSVPETIDQAFIMVPAHAVPQAIDQCCEAGIPVATIFSAGFAEMGEEGASRQRDMVARARKAGVRLIGPNCIGLVNVHAATALSVSAVLVQEKLRPGPLSIISQSGNMLGTLLSRGQARGLGFSKLISVGNECDLGVGEIANILVDDPDTGSILLFLETFRDAEHLSRAARRAYDAGKPVIVYKLGRSEVGRKAAASHTGAMLGDDAVSKAFFRANGMLRVEMLETLFELPQLIMGYKPPAGRRVAILTGTGGGAATIADRLGTYGVSVVPPSEQVIATLRESKISISDAPITDLTLGRSGGGVSAKILSTFIASDHCDAVVSVIGGGAQTEPEKVITDRILNADRKGKPLAVFLAPKADHGLAFLQQHQVAGFRTPETCVDALNAYVNWRPPAQAASPAVELGTLEKLVSAAAGDDVNEQAALDMFAALGIQRVQAQVITDPGQPIQATGPCAVKLLSRNILHKTDAGMVMLGVAPGDVSHAAGRLLAKAKKEFPQARIDGVLVQPMESGLFEVILGYRHEPEVGPTVLLGVGGIMAEIRRSFSVRLAPLDLDMAREMLDEIPELRILQGFRNLPPGDCEALARAVWAMSRLALLKGQPIAEAEINPLIIKGSGVVAVDGLIRWRTA